MTKDDLTRPELNELDIEHIARKVNGKLLTGRLFEAARFLGSYGFHVLPRPDKHYFKTGSQYPDYLSLTPEAMQNPFSYDFVRIETLRALARELGNRNPEACIAELGVYRGDFAAYLGQACPDRKFYLFDTFEGSSRDEFDHDFQRYGDNRGPMLSNPNRVERYFEDLLKTTEELVLSKIINPGRCVIKKGLFPETAAGLEDETFALVSIDANLYKPTIAGLEFFYPRMVKGGYIMIHDYSEDWPGVKEAITEFTGRAGCSMMPICDLCSSVVIGKP